MVNDRFMPGVAEQLGWHVYLLVDPRNPEVFYVGKGKGERCFAHIAQARRTAADKAAGYEKLARIRAIEDSGHSVGIDILSHGLTKDESFKIEAAAIDLLGFDQLANIVRGRGCCRMSIAEANAMYAKPVEIDPDHAVVLVNLWQSFRPGMSDTELYERTRKWWPIAKWRRQVGTPGAPVWAFAVAFGVVRGVYRITGWERPTAADVAVDRKRTRRWGFLGQRDLEMEKHYLAGDVSKYITSQWPLRFLPASRRAIPSAVDQSGKTSIESRRPATDGPQELHKS